MKTTTKYECPCCGAQSVINYDGDWLECLECRWIGYDDDQDGLFNGPYSASERFEQLTPDNAPAVRQTT